MARSRRNPEYSRADAPLLLQPRAHRRRRPARPLGIARDLVVDVLVGDCDLFAPRHLVEHQRAATASAAASR